MNCQYQKIKRGSIQRHRRSSSIYISMNCVTKANNSADFIWMNTDYSKTEMCIYNM